MADVKQILIEIDLQTGKVVGGTAEINKQLKSISSNAKIVEQQLQKTSKATNDFGGAAGIAGATAAELGRTISDMPYGIQAVTNNISQLGSMFALLVSSSNGVGNALTNLGRVMAGPAGILLLFQGAVAAIDFFAQSMRRAKKESEETKKELDEMNATLQEQQFIFNELSKIGFQYSNDVSKLFAKNMKEVGSYLEELRKEGPITQEVYNAAINAGNDLLNARINQNKAQQALIKSQEELTRLEKEEPYNKKAIQTESMRLGQARLDLTEAIDAEQKALQFLNYQATEEIVLTGKTKKEKEELNETRERSISSIIREATRSVASFRNAYIQRRVAQEAEVRDDEGFLQWKATFFENLSNKEAFSFEERTAYYRQYVIATQQLGDMQLRNEQIKLNAMEQINLSYANSIGSIFKTIANLAGENRFLQAVALIGESAAGIAKIVISTKSANAAAPLKYALIPGGQALAKAEIAANNLAAKVGIAANVASTAKAVSALKAPVAVPSAANIGSEPSAAISQAPSFNVVGATTQNQLAAAILGSQQEPMRAYVVSSDVTTAQQLERNIVQGASI
jgi:hypothetical protein